MKKRLNDDEIYELFMSRVRASSQRKVAIDLGVSPSYVNDMVLKRRQISHLVVAWLGYKKVVSYHFEEEK